ncbi:MAG TPA: hypothetical protein DCZ94_05880 [Lentisphaeria bacterium]|nr:MAG: hypothetical protein A2X48_07390 [Lentisphaerae bacterium GWF2_49_21]HBC86465.1 hypothetical protein [Lentisphaeria bacterium]
MNREEIEKYLLLLNEKLKARNITGEIGIVGGAVMCLLFKARVSTKDIDGIFSPTKEIREAIKEISEDNGLPEDWLNDGVKGFIQRDPPKELFREYSNLKVWVPTAEYMLAMKCVSARSESQDKEDIEFLLRHLGITDKETVFGIISKYYYGNTIQAKSQFIVEELLDKVKKISSSVDAVKESSSKGMKITPY